VIKFLTTTPTPPNEKTIHRLNALAKKHPFCQLHRVKKHDTLKAKLAAPVAQNMGISCGEISHEVG
jgi:hypothetical protein